MEHSAVAHEESRKSHLAFRTISEVAQEIDVPQHVLRFWESRFSQIRPLKRGGGRRYYRPEDVELLRCIKNYLYKQGYTIKGVQRLLKESRRALDAAPLTLGDYQRPSEIAEQAKQAEDYSQDFADGFSGITQLETPPAIPVEASQLARSLEAVTSIHNELAEPATLMRKDAEPEALIMQAEEVVSETVAEAAPAQEPVNDLATQFAALLAQQSEKSEQAAKTQQANKAELRGILSELLELRDMLQAVSNDDTLSEQAA
jgi:DNA-binding transcriptional MerR regulator